MQVSLFIRSQETSNGLEEVDDSEHNAMVVEIFESEDKDRDGFISHDEFNGPKHEEL